MDAQQRLEAIKAHRYGIEVQVGALAPHYNVDGTGGHKLQVGRLVVIVRAVIVDLDAGHHRIIRLLGVYTAQCPANRHLSSARQQMRQWPCDRPTCRRAAAEVRRGLGCVA